MCVVSILPNMLHNFYNIKANFMFEFQIAGFLTQLCACVNFDIYSNHRWFIIQDDIHNPASNHMEHT